MAEMVTTAIRTQGVPMGIQVPPAWEETQEETEGLRGQGGIRSTAGGLEGRTVVEARAALPPTRTSIIPLLSIRHRAEAVEEVVDTFSSTSSATILTAERWARSEEREETDMITDGRIPMEEEEMGVRVARLRFITPSCFHR